MSTLSEQEFRVKSDEALDEAREALLPLADEKDHSDICLSSYLG